MLQLSSPSVLQSVNNLVAQGQYPQAYQMVYNDLVSHNSNLSPGDQDVLKWIDTAIQVNSGADTPTAIAIRANNAAAVQLQQGRDISLFGPEQQNASNAVAEAFFSSLNTSNGVLGTINEIAQIDAAAGTIGSLGLNAAGWGGAVPDSLSFVTGFNTLNYYNALTPALQQQADITHLVAADAIAAYYASGALGASSDLQTTIVDQITSFNSLLAKSPNSGQYRDGYI